MALPKSSSSTDGFFQSLPDIAPLYYYSDDQSNPNNTVSSDDKVFPRILNLYLPSNEHTPRHSIHNLARLALNPSVLAHAVDAEVNHPVLKPFDTFGRANKNDPLWTTNGWK